MIAKVYTKTEEENPKDTIQDQAAKDRPQSTKQGTEPGGLPQNKNKCGQVFQARKAFCRRETGTRKDSPEGSL